MEHIITGPIKALCGAPDVWAYQLAQAVVGLGQGALIIANHLPGCMSVRHGLRGAAVLTVGTACRIVLPHFPAHENLPTMWCIFLSPSKFDTDNRNPAALAALA
jgi:hypothetical protein